MIDPIMEEVRKYLDEHALRFNYDLDMICEDLRSRHAQNLDRLKQIRTVGKARLMRWMLVRSTGIETVGAELRGYMSAMKAII